MLYTTVRVYELFGVVARDYGGAVMRRVSYVILDELKISKILNLRIAAAAAAAVTRSSDERFRPATVTV